MTRDEALRILRSGPDGIQRWNEYRRIAPGQVFYTYGKDGFGEQDLSDLDLRNANLDRVYLADSILRGANLRGASLRDATLYRVDFSTADLRDVDMTMARLQEAKFCNAVLDGATFYDAHLTWADFRYASLRGADLRVIQMSGADFNQADMTDVRLTDASRSWYSKSVLDLMTARGVEEAVFPQLAAYIAEIATYLRRSDIGELAHSDRDFFRSAIARVPFLARVYDTVPVDQRHEPVLLALAEAKRNPQSLYALDPYKFEHLVAEVLASLGWKVRVTARTRDNGYDIFAVTPAGNTDLDSAWIIECKRYAQERRVGISEIRELYAVKGELRVPKALLATTSYFTSGAQKFAVARYDLDLVDFKKLIKWINNYRPLPGGQLHMHKSQLRLPGEA